MSVARKEFPDGYPNDALEVLNAMSMTDGKEVVIVGSMSLRSQVYAGDYDAHEVVNGTIHSLVRKFKSCIKNILSIPNTYISDIKSGSIEEWKIISEPYDYQFSKERLETLHSKGIIDSETYRDGKKRIKQHISKLQYLTLKRDLRPNIIRWKPYEVLRGKKTVHGRVFTLEEAFQSPVITKIDVISWVQNNRFTDFSMIYEFRHQGRVLNPGMEKFEESIRENIFMLHHEANYFKMAKRMFSLARYRRDSQAIEKLSALFNGDAGRVYMVYGDIGTLESLFETSESIPLSKIDFEINQFKGRLSNIALERYISEEHRIFRMLDHLYNERNSKENTLKVLKEIKNVLGELLSYYAKAYLIKTRLFPRY